MTHRKLKKLLREKPYLLNDAFTLGENEAAALEKQHGCPSVETILSRAALREDWPSAAKRRRRMPSRRAHWFMNGWRKSA